MAGSYERLAQYFEYDVFYKLNDLIADYVPSYLERCGEISPVFLKNTMNDDGEIWYFITIEGQAYWPVPYINGDWLEQAGLSVPTTSEELEAALYAFQEDHPDNVIWARGPWWNFEQRAFEHFGTSSNWMHIREGEYIYGPIVRNAEMKEALTWLSKLYKDGIIDPEFASRDNDTSLALITQNQTGFYYSWGDNGPTWGPGGTDGVNFRITGPLPPQGRTPYVEMPSFRGGSFFIPTDGNADINKILEMFEFIYSLEGTELFTFGLENDTFTKTGNLGEWTTYSFTDKVINHELSGINGRRQFGIDPVPMPRVSLMEGYDALVGEESAHGKAMAQAFWGPQAPILSGTADELAITTQISADINKYVSDCVAKFIAGEMDVETDWDTFTDTINQMGYEEWNSIIQTQYQRWMNRGN